MKQLTNDHIETPKIIFIMFKPVTDNVHERALDKCLYSGAKISKRPPIGGDSSKIRQ